MLACKSLFGLSGQLEPIEQDKFNEFLSCPMPVNSRTFDPKANNYNLDSLRRYQWELEAILERIKAHLLKPDQHGTNTQ